MTTTADPQIVPRPPAAAPALRAADRGVADALESVLSDNTQRVYAAQWRLFNVSLCCCPAATAGGHGAAHGPERPPTHENRTPGLLEAGRWYGRPLHPRRVCRVGAEVP